MTQPWPMCAQAVRDMYLDSVGCCSDAIVEEHVWVVAGELGDELMRECEDWLLYLPGDLDDYSSPWSVAISGSYLQSTDDWAEFSSWEEDPTCVVRMSASVSSTLAALFEGGAP